MQRAERRPKRLSQVNRPTGWMDLLHPTAFGSYSFASDALYPRCYCSLCVSITHLHFYSSARVRPVLFYSYCWQRLLLQLCFDRNQIKESYTGLQYTHLYFLSFSSFFCYYCSLSFSLSSFLFLSSPHLSFDAALISDFFLSLSLSLSLLLSSRFLLLCQFCSSLFFSLLQVSSPQATDVTRERQWHTKLTKDC